MKQPTKIAFLLPALTAGGAERVLITLMNGLPRDHFAPALIAVKNEGPMGALVAGDIPQQTLGRHGVIASLPRILAAVRREKPDIIVSTMAPMNFAALLLKPFFPHAKFIVREAITPSFILQRRKALSSFIRLAYKTLYACADLVISPAQIIIDEFAAMGVKTAHHKILPNPVDEEGLRALQTIPPRKNPEIVHFIAAGRLHKQKGFDRLITALKSFPHASWHLTILGEGPERSALESLVHDLDLTDHISLPGHADSLGPLLGGGDAFLMPSRFEGLPNAALEALACGTKVIATKESGGIEEVAAQTPPGALTVVNDMNEFIAAMAQVKPGPVTTFRPSLLPIIYKKDAIVAHFVALLDLVQEKR